MRACVAGDEPEKPVAGDWERHPAIGVSPEGGVDTASPAFWPPVVPGTCPQEEWQAPTCGRPWGLGRKGLTVHTSAVQRTQDASPGRGVPA